MASGTPGSRKDSPDASVPTDRVLHQSLYAELKRIAQQAMGRERPGHTLQPTALVHEAFMRLRLQRNLAHADRRTLLAAAARQMRQLLIDHARQRNANKRDGRRNVPLAMADGEVAAVTMDDAIDIAGALDRLSRLNSRQSEVVTLRYYGGLTNEEIAVELDVSVRTVENDWRFARTWLRRQLSDGEPS